MARELYRRENMQTAQARSEYVGALIEAENRLVLVPVSESEPWAAFRQMRRLMRKQKSPATIAMFEAETPVEHQAEVISLASRRRAG